MPRHASAEYALLNEEGKPAAGEQLSSDEFSYQSKSRSIINPSILLHWIGHAISLVLLVGFATYVWLMSRGAGATCALKHSVWSPALDFTNDEMEDRIFVGTFGKKTPFKGPPSPEVTAAWDTIWDVNTVNITADEMIKMNRSLDSIQYPPDLGGGYLAQAEGVHHLHCLYAIWRDHHLDYFPADQSIKAKRPAFYERHYEHCMDIIRQRLMCTADTGLVTFRWVEDEDIPEPDFNTLHKCASYDKLLEWNELRRANKEVNDIKWVKPADAITLPHAP